MRAAFLLAWRRLHRGRTLPLLLSAVAFATWFLPALSRSDGTAAGEREMYFRAVLGLTAVVTFLVTLCGACGVLADERAHRRLSLTVLRPAAAFRTLLGTWLAYVAMAAIALSFAGALTGFFAPGGRPACRHHVSPELPSPVVAAQAMLADYLADPATPDAVRKAPRSAVLALLAAKETDRYDPVAPGATVRWPFPAALRSATNPVLRVRFATQFEARADLRGSFAFGPFAAAVSNSTQAVLEVPLARVNACATDACTLAFTNTGRDTVMLRPRRDLAILTPADGFAFNLVRALLQTLASAGLAAAFGLFLSSALSRPVAVFTALVSAAVIFMAPDVITQYPDALETSFADRVGLMFSRGIYFLTSSLSASTPIADFAEGRCLEWADTCRATLLHLVFLPAFFLSLAAFVVRRHALPEND